MKLRFQLLPCLVEVVVDDDGLTDKLRYLVNSAEQDVAPLRTLRYRVAGGGPYEIHEEGDPLQSVGTPDDVLAVIYRRCHQRAHHLLALGGWSLLHACVARVGDHRILVAGGKGTGKTTLMLRLLYEGHGVEGDELAFVRDGLVVAFPRRLRLKQGIERVVPEVAGVVGDLPTTTQDDTTVAAFDPREAGFPWRLGVAPVDAVVFGTANHGGSSSLARMPSGAMVQRLLSQSIRIDRSAAAGARLVEVCSRLSSGGGYELRLGDLREATTALEDAFGRARGDRPRATTGTVRAVGAAR